MSGKKTIMNLYNTASRSKEPLEVSNNLVKMYACGPTVYNYAHIGNLKTYIVEDLLRRSLKFLGYQVKHVMNITDVGHLTDDNDHGEDKMVKSAREQQKSVWDIADHYTRAFMEDSRLLNIEEPEVICKATDHIGDMIGMVETLEEKGYAYRAEGNVYFDIEKFPDYGKMAKIKLDDQQAGARVALDSGKHNPHDFALWFTRSKFENQAMLWESPWGKGYPGWHIECSAMSRKYLGDQFDIHCGGTDHIPVHHTNEIAQSEAASGKSPWVRFWFHSAFLLFDNSKMSKSKGTFLTLGKLQELGYDPLDYRFFVLGANYRTQLNFSDESMTAAQTARHKLMDKIGELPPWDESYAGAPAMERLDAPAAEIYGAFRDALADDLNTPKALAQLWGLLKEPNIPQVQKLTVLHEMDRVLGLDLTRAAGAHAAEEPLDDRIQQLIEERREARSARNFARADEIRDQLAEEGITLIDSPEGTTWKKNL